MTSARLVLRACATAATLALVAGPLATGASAAAKRKTPTPLVTTRPANPTNATTATFAFTDTAAGSAYTCSLDFATYVACTSPRTYSGLTAGSHSFRVRAQAPNSTVSSAASETWTVDLTPPPAPTLSGVPTSQTKSNSATLTFSDSEGTATFRCTLDGGAAATCTSPRQLTSLTDGSHTFSVVARDAAGNLSSAASGTWTVDTTPPPAPNVTTGPADPTNATSATFGVFDTDASAALTCSLDAGAFAPCEPTVTYTLLPNGPHTFDLKAADPLGNASSAPRFSWTVDITAPTPPAILTAPDPVTKTAVGHFTFDPHDATQLRCAVDSTTVYADCASPFDTSALADGPHTLRVLGRDALSNESGATPYSWAVDTTPPPAATVTGPAAYTTATSATFGVSDTDPSATFTCALDGAAAATCADGVSYAGPLANGAHTLTVTAVDGAGNGTATAYHWTVDSVPPTVSISVPSTDVAGTAVATFGESVRGVSATSFAILLSGAARAATVTCKDASNAVVSCSTGPVKVATLRPAAALVPGEQYVATANPGNAATIADLAGNALAAKTVTFRAQTTVEEGSVATHYAWRNVGASSAYGGSYRTEHSGGAQMTYAFTGTSVTWYTVTGRSQGQAYVYVDGVRKAVVNDYAAATAYKVARTVSGLTNAKHVLRIYVTGLKGNAAGTGTYVSVDAVKVGATLTVTPSMDALWRKASAPGASGSTVATDDLAGASAWLTFRGTSVSWWTSTGRDRGKAQVYVDGVLKGTYDLYGASTAYNVKRLFSGLTNAVHTVKVVALGTHRAGATGSLVTVDRWTIG